MDKNLCLLKKYLKIYLTVELKKRRFIYTIRLLFFKRLNIFNSISFINMFLTFFLDNKNALKNSHSKM